MQPQDPQQPQQPEQPQAPQSSQPPQPLQPPQQTSAPQPTQPPVAPPQPAYQQQPYQQPAYATTPPPKKRFPTWLKIVAIVLGSLVILIAIFVAIVLGATEAPKKVSDQFINDIQSGDTSAAYALTSQSFKDATTEQQLGDIITQARPLLQGDEKVVGRAVKQTTAAKTATVVYVVGTSGNEKYVKILLQDENGTWRIASLDLSDSPLSTSEQ